LACVNANGDVELHGRIDNQIKILGNRIEPEEITFHLNRFPDVKSSTIFSYNHTTHVELIAAVSYASNKPNVAAMRKYLQKYLPPAMIPARYLLLEKIPIAPSGKIDLEALISMVRE
jgi:acyl-coenzyme A synthetase/AMP-(fatty) acid ligase